VLPISRPLVFIVPLRILFTDLPNALCQISGAACKPILLESNLPTDILRQLWNLADQDKDGYLDLGEFCVAMHLAKVRERIQPSRIPDSNSLIYNFVTFCPSPPSCLLNVRSLSRWTPRSNCAISPALRTSYGAITQVARVQGALPPTLPPALLAFLHPTSSVAGAAPTTPPAPVAFAGASSFPATNTAVANAQQSQSQPQPQAAQQPVQPPVPPAPYVYGSQPGVDEKM